VFLQGLRDVVEAQDGMVRAARLAGLNRESLYRQLSRRGNPSLSSLNALLTAPGLKLRFAPGLNILSPRHGPPDACRPVPTSRLIPFPVPPSPVTDNTHGRSIEASSSPGYQ
jgi:hypothetical protein